MSDNSSGAVVRSDFSGEQIQRQVETASTAVAAAEKTAIEARHILAKRFPRDWENVRVKLLAECKRPGFADAAIYRKPVGRKFDEATNQWVEKFVEGLSVRFAEAALRHMGNVYTSFKSIYDDDDKSIVRTTVMDLESNFTSEGDVTVRKTVERSKLKKGQVPLSRRVNSYGEPVFLVPATDDELLNKVNALNSKALRNGAMRILPGDIQDECEALCRKVQADRDAKDPDAARKALFQAFADQGIMPAALKAYLGATGDTLQPAQLAELRAIYAAIRDGETTWNEVVAAKEAEAAQAQGQAAQGGHAQPAQGGNAGGAQTSAAPSGATSRVQDLVNKHKQQQKNGNKAPQGAAQAPPQNQARPSEAPQGTAPGQSVDEHGDVRDEMDPEPGSNDKP